MRGEQIDQSGVGPRFRCRWQHPGRGQSRRAVLRSGLLRTGSRAVVAPRLEMACRFEEIPQPGDFVEYEILDQSVIVVRPTIAVRAYYNVCRHRGVRLVGAAGRVGVRLPVPWLVLEPRRQEHLRAALRGVRRAQLGRRRHRSRAGAVRGVGRMRVDQPRRQRPAAAGVHRAVRHDARRVEGRSRCARSGGSHAGCR